MTTINDIAVELRDDNTTAVHLLYAFNSVGKTRLSVAYKNATKNEDGTHKGIYYNAYSEDLFVWDNDDENDGANIRLTVLPSSLDKFHAGLSEFDINTKLEPYRPRFDFRFTLHEDTQKGIESISFFPAGTQPGDGPPIKISRGEERIFVWCFFLSMMDIDDWGGTQNQHIFIDDPVSSLDDHNIFVTVSTLYDLIEQHFDKRTIIVTTHHVGLFSILSNWLTKGERQDKYEPKTKGHILSRKNDNITLETHQTGVFLYHLRLLQLLKQAQRDNNVRAHHLVLLRQILENVSSFLGVGRISYTLERIGFQDADEITRIVHTLSHKDVYSYESDTLVPDNLMLFEKILDRLNDHFKFVTHD